MMKEFKGTPGPWEKGKAPNGDDLMVYCDDNLGSAVADCRLPHSMAVTINKKEANAKLIAAAPELLEALQLVLKHPYGDEAQKKAHAAITKALS